MENGGVDPLFQLKTHFFIGNFQAAINYGNEAKTNTDAERIERDTFIYRSYIGLKNYAVVVDEISDDAHPSLQAVKLYASYKSSPESKDIVHVTIKEWSADPSIANNPVFQLIVGTIFAEEDNFEDALRSVHDSKTLEMGMQLVYIYLKMNRIDLAEKQVKLMVQTDEDSPVTQLALASYNMAAGSEKIQEAYYIFQDLADKYVSTPLLLNGMACAQMLMENFEEAEGFLNESLSKAHSDENTLVNMITCVQQMRKPETVANRYISQLKSISPNHAFFTSRKSMEEAFDVAVASLVEA